MLNKYYFTIKIFLVKRCQVVLLVLVITIIFCKYSFSRHFDSTGIILLINEILCTIALIKFLYYGSFVGLQIFASLTLRMNVELSIVLSLFYSYFLSHLFHYILRVHTHILVSVYSIFSLL